MTSKAILGTIQRMDNNSKLSTQPYKGVRDFYPKDMSVLQQIFNVMRKSVEKFGYLEYNASPIEPSSIYQAKSGDEIANEQTYNFLDKAGRNISLRPEMTPTIARMIAGRDQKISLPIRWYSIPNVFRYENPQRGRLREHYQLNVDIFGGEPEIANAEILMVVHEIMTGFGASTTDFAIKINDRTILADIYKKFEVPKEKIKDVSRLLDKKEKVSKTIFDEALESLVGSEISKPLAEILSSPEFIIETLGIDNPGIKNVIGLIEKLENYGVTNLIFEPTLVRGFDYYNSFVFEVFDTDSENRRSLFGGGRYDSLTGLFSNEEIPAVGFGMGDVVLQDFLKTHNILPESLTPADLSIISVDQNSYDDVYLVARKIREFGLNVDIDISNKKVGAQIKRSVSNSIPFALFIGEEEIRNKKYNLKDLRTQEEKQLNLEEIVEVVKNSK